jgi:hypothetical protein
MRSDGFVVVIEGIDKSGKSSLAAAVRGLTGWPVMKFGPPKNAGGASLEYFKALVDNPGPFIADRFHLGESVYGPLYRGTERMHPVSAAAIEGILLGRGALLVLMEDSPDRVAERFTSLGEDFSKVADVSTILADFDREWRESRLAKIRATWGSELLPYTVLAVVEAMRAAREATG